MKDLLQQLRGQSSAIGLLIQALNAYEHLLLFIVQSAD